MVKSSIALLFAPAFLGLTSVVSAQQCPGDKTGCWMCPGSTLMNCLGTAEEAIAACDKQTSLSSKDKAQCYCNGYQAEADCWGRGLFCLEWLPNQVEADKMCALASSHTQPATKALTSVVKEAASVRDAIWHDDSGTDIPRVHNDIDGRSRPSATHLTGKNASGADGNGAGGKVGGGGGGGSARQPRKSHRKKKVSSQKKVTHKKAHNHHLMERAYPTPPPQPM